MDYIFANEEECSSGCESGWTLYLDHSPNASYDQSRRLFSKSKKLKNDEEEEEEEEEEDEDLSMVSDASSGPPHVHDQDDHDALVPKKSREINRRRKNNNNNNLKVQDRRDSLLDDTASSPFFDFSNKSSTLTTNKTRMENVSEYSQGYSTTQFEQVRPTYEQQHYDEFFQSSQSLNQLQHQNYQW